MLEISVNQFRANIKSFIDSAFANHSGILVKRRAGNDFVVQSAEDYERDQETLYVLQNSSLAKQITESFHTHREGSGYSPILEEMNEINSI